MKHKGKKQFYFAYIAVAMLPVAIAALILTPAGLSLYIELLLLALILFFLYRFWANGFYFKATNTKFVVKNYALPFWSTSCRLNEIVTIRIKKIKGDDEHALRVVSNRSRSMLYHNPYFSLNDWERLSNDLYAKGVAVEWVEG